MKWRELRVGDMLIAEPSSTRPCFILIEITPEGYGKWMSTNAMATAVDSFNHLTTDEEEIGGVRRVASRDEADMRWSDVRPGDTLVGHEVYTIVSVEGWQFTVLTHGDMSTQTFTVRPETDYSLAEFFQVFKGRMMGE